jgi:hypothetical protein
MVGHTPVVRLAETQVSLFRFFIVIQDHRYLYFCAHVGAVFNNTTSLLPVRLRLRLRLRLLRVLPQHSTQSHSASLEVYA